jgi:hypothetical protein
MLALLRLISLFIWEQPIQLSEADPESGDFNMKPGHFMLKCKDVLKIAYT